jgi:hypothetical protein
MIKKYLSIMLLPVNYFTGKSIHLNPALPLQIARLLGIVPLVPVTASTPISLAEDYAYFAKQFTLGQKVVFLAKCEVFL